MVRRKKVYIVTYRKDDVLNANLASLWAMTSRPDALEVTVLSNHPEVHIDPRNRRPNLRLVMNTTRMPNAWGYLARDWNFALLDAFRDSENSGACDWCVLAQNAVTWLADWDGRLDGYWDRFAFIQQPYGDQCLALTIETVRQVGFFDERFTTLAWHEVDYFLRCLIAQRDRTSLNEPRSLTRRQWNFIGSVLIPESLSGVDPENDAMHTNKTHFPDLALLCEKFGLPGMAVTQATDRFLRFADSPFFLKRGELDWYPFFWTDRPCPDASQVYQGPNRLGRILAGLPDPFYRFVFWLLHRPAMLLKQLRRGPR